ncbi:hypothetical protein ACJJTC_012933 [Scirpophaga incertulas]
MPLTAAERQRRYKAKLKQNPEKYEESKRKNYHVKKRLAGHGKGPADGIGGYLKRSADDMVARGPDISNADNFYECLKDVSKIKLFMISQEDIQNIENHIPSTLQTHSGTRKLHQIFSKGHGHITGILVASVKDAFVTPKVYQPLPDKAK